MCVVVVILPEAVVMTFVITFDASASNSANALV